MFLCIFSTLFLLVTRSLFQALVIRSKKKDTKVVFKVFQPLFSIQSCDTTKEREIPRSADHIQKDNASSFRQVHVLLHPPIPHLLTHLLPSHHSHGQVQPAAAGAGGDLLRRLRRRHEEKPGKSCRMIRLDKGPVDTRDVFEPIFFELESNRTS